MRISYLLFLLILCTSCNQHSEKIIPHSVQEINGRDEIISYGQKVRRPVYQAKVPLVWQRHDPSEQESLMDTTKPIVTFTINEKLRLTVHNFPTHSLEERIPPGAQLERWGSQLTGGTFRSEKVGHGGFIGLYFEGVKGAATVCAWSMQLDLQHYQTLHFLAATVEEEEHYRQMTADYTIKVSGPSDLIEKHRDEIQLFADSFELIGEIPDRV